MRIRWIFSALALSLSALLSASAPAGADGFALPTVEASSFAQSIADDASFFGISEVRLGPAFSNLELDNKNGSIPDLSSFNKARLDSLQFDVFSKTPWPDVLKWVGSPRLSFGGVIGLGGYESLIHAGIDLHVPVFSTPLYLEAGVGLGLHTGYLNNAPPGFHNLGCQDLIHWEYGVGWNVNEHVTATLEWQHMSNVIFHCHPNEGLNDLGMVVGWKF